MPVIIKCRRCSFELYKGLEPVPPEDIVKKYGFRCPRCLSQLSKKPPELTVRPVTKRRKFLLRLR